MEKSKKLRLNKMTVAELNSNEQGAIYGGAPLTVTCGYNTTCPAASEQCPPAQSAAACGVTTDCVIVTLGNECARSYIGEANCNGAYTYNVQDHSCRFDCNTNNSICECPA
ncbi:MAG: class I lanthipeptide [Bacteroidales bacterium]|jgi:hypothetical protein|nr:class I lanthipeptide [Bacteroidales bacterium]